MHPRRAANRALVVDIAEIGVPEPPSVERMADLSQTLKRRRRVARNTPRPADARARLTSSLPRAGETRSPAGEAREAQPKSGDAQEGEASRTPRTLNRRSGKRGGCSFGRGRWHPRPPGRPGGLFSGLSTSARSAPRVLSVAPRRRPGGVQRSQTNERVPTSVYRPFCDDNVLVLVALTS